MNSSLKSSTVGEPRRSTFRHARIHVVTPTGSLGQWQRRGLLQISGTAITILNKPRLTSLQRVTESTQAWLPGPCNGWHVGSP